MKSVPHSRGDMIAHPNRTIFIGPEVQVIVICDRCSFNYSTNVDFKEALRVANAHKRGDHDAGKDLDEEVDA